MTSEPDLTELASIIVACFVSANLTQREDVPALIASVHAALVSISSGPNQHGRRLPAVPVETSITQDYLICLEDGHRLRALRRYLQRKHSLTPEEYRARWNLPADYPMVAPAYSKLRSVIAKRSSRQVSKTLET